MTTLEQLVDACLMPGFAGANVPDWAIRALDAAWRRPALSRGEPHRRRGRSRAPAQVPPGARKPWSRSTKSGDVTRMDYRNGKPISGNLAWAGWTKSARRTSWRPPCGRLRSVASMSILLPRLTSTATRSTGDRRAVVRTRARPDPGCPPWLGVRPRPAATGGIAAVPSTSPATARRRRTPTTPCRSSPPTSAPSASATCRRSPRRSSRGAPA